MEKDFELKADPQYDSQQLRGRINRKIKALRDEAHEVKHPQVKRLLIIPVTGGDRTSKYINNKTRLKM